MLTAISKRLFGGAGSAQIKTELNDDEIPRYPPFAKGLPVADVDKVIGTQHELIERIRASLGFNAEEHQRLLMPVIRQYAAFVHLLPASEAHHHRGAGGLFRHGLEVAFWASQASEAVIFNIEATPKTRRDKEPRWRLATALAGLLHDVGKPISDVAVTNKDGTLTWNPYAEPLYAWAQKHGVTHYFLRWRDNRHKRHERFSLLAVERIIPQEALEYLHSDGPEVVEALLEAIAGSGLSDPVTRIVLKADQESVAKDLRESRMGNDEFSYGIPVERYVFDAIRRLIKTGVWKVNQPGAKVWNLHQGVFISWKELGDLYTLIAKDQIPGIPRDPDTLADILIERGFAIPNRVAEKGDSAYYRYWEVLPSVLTEGPVSTKQKQLMLRLESPDLVFTSEAPVPIDAEVDNDEPQQSGAIVSIEQTEVEQPALTMEGAEGDVLSDLASQTEEDPVIATQEAPGPEDQPLDDGLTAIQQLNKSIDAEAVDDLSFFGAGDIQARGPSSDAPERGGVDKREDGLDQAQEPRTEPEVSPVWSSDTEEAPQKTLKALFSKYGDAAVLLEAAVLPVLTGASTLGDVLVILDNKAAILYPDGASKLGKATEVLAVLKEARAITPDPIMPTKNVTEINGYRVIVLERKLSAAIVASIREVEVAVSVAPLSSPPKEPVDPVPSVKRKTKQKNSVPKPELKTEPAKTEVKPSGGQAVALLRSPISKNKTAVDEPKSKTEPFNKPQSSLVVDRVARNRSKADSKTAMVDDDLITPAKSLTPEEAIAQLKEMIVKREGRWLVGPVMKEDGFLVTSAKALEMIIAENITLSKYVIRGMLHGGQRKPILRIKEGKLHLKLEEES